MARTKGVISWTLVVLSGVTLILVVTDIFVAERNRSFQMEVNQRQQFINQSIQLGRVRETLIRSVAQTAMADNDDKLRDLLSQYGITINPAPATAAPSTAPAPSPTPASPGK